MTRCLQTPIRNKVASGWDSSEEVAADGDFVFVFPATAAQGAFWYLDRLQPGNPAYNISIRFRLSGQLRIEALERSLNRLVSRHESLRTVFAAKDGIPIQIVTPELPIGLPYDDLRHENLTNRLDRAESLAIDESRLSFDLARGPLIRARVLQIEDDQHILLITVHHIVSDGWSLGVITRELCAFYDADCLGLDPELPELAIQYGDVAVWQERWLNSKELAGQLAFWNRQLRDLPIVEIPTDRPRPPAQTFAGQMDTLLLPRQLTDRLEALCKSEQVTPYMLTLAAFQLLLHRRTGLDDIAVGSVQAGRSRVEFEPMIGLFINSLVLRTDFSGDPTFLKLLTRVQETVLQAFANQDVPFGRVVEAVQPRRDPGRHPLFQINFMHQPAFLPSLEVSGLTLTPIPSVSPGSIYDLNFFIVERAEGWRASCEYNIDLYDGSTIRTILEQFQNLLMQIAAGPTRPISSYQLKSAVESEFPMPSQNGPTRAISVARPFVGRVANSFVAPRDPVEMQLAELWEKVLGHGPVSVTANFFDIGGHSLLAARLLAQVEQALGKVVSFAAFLQAPTIESFAARLQLTDLPGISEQVHWIKSDGTRPIWVVLTSQPQLYRLLAQHLHPDQPVMALTSPELAVLGEKFTVEDVAANLIKAMRTAIPHGPYYLGGWCVSGVVAYEMARQLQEQGDEVALLALMDAYCPVYVRRFRSFRAKPIRWYHAVEKYVYHFNIIRRLPVKEMAKYMGSGIRDILGRWRGRIRKFLGIRRKATPEDDIKRFSEILLNASVRYEPKPTMVPVALFRSEVFHKGWFRDPALGWTPFARAGLTLYELPGDHDEIFQEPVVEQLGTFLSEALTRSEKLLSAVRPVRMTADRPEGVK